jgi:hypothetical protein
MDTNPKLGDSDNTLLFKIAEVLLSGSFGGGITQAGADARYVLKSGDTVTGALILNSTLSVGADTVDNGFLVVDPDAAAPIMLTRHVADNAPAILRVQKKGTTGSVNGAVANNDNLARVDFYAWDGSGFFPGAVFQLVANQAWTGSAHGGRLSVNVVANGATSTTEMLRFTSAAMDLRNSAVLQSGGTQVVSSRKTGWTAATGTATRTTFDTATVTTELLAQRVKALLDDLISHGLIGA